MIVVAWVQYGTSTVVLGHGREPNYSEKPNVIVYTTNALDRLDVPTSQ